MFHNVVELHFSEREGSIKTSKSIASVVLAAAQPSRPIDRLEFELLRLAITDLIETVYVCCPRNSLSPELPGDGTVALRACHFTVWPISGLNNGENNAA